MQYQRGSVIPSFSDALYFVMSYGDSVAEKTDVLIIGAGPAGLMCVNALGRLGVRTIIVDRREVGEVYGQADGIQPGTQEMWQSYGLRERLIKEGCPIIAFGTYMTNPETQCIEVRQPQGPNICVSDARYPYEVTIPIENMEAILKDSAEDHGVYVERPFTPTSIEIESGDESDDVQDLTSYPVKVVLERPEGKGTPTKRHIHAKYLVGCDGAHSWVRENAGIKMKRDGEDRPVNYGVLDFTPTGNFPDTRIKNVITSPVCGMIGVKQVAGRWIPRPAGTARIYVPLEPEYWEKKDVIVKEVLLKTIQKTVSKVIRPYEMNITNCTWVSTYKVIQQVASTYSVKNRVFIAGDACHTHSPKAGQGANASMHDTHNLAWKIAYVIRGWAKPSLLSTYDEERRSYAQELIALDRDVAMAFELGGSENKYKRIWNDKNRFIRCFSFFFQKPSFRFTPTIFIALHSGVGILYHSRLTPFQDSSPLAPNITPGERVPPSSILRLNDWTPLNVQDLIISDGTFKLLIFPGTISPPSTSPPPISVNSSSHTIRLDGLDTFAQAVVSGAKSVQGNTVGQDKEFLRLYVIVADPKENIHWTDVPEIVRNEIAVYVDDTLTPTDTKALASGVKRAYDIYGIDRFVGAAALVRPDAHISLVTSLDDEGAKEIIQFLRNL
ncbi:hypothetical protein EW146_g9879 [Bondarzewia mesenterica]|uniref:FAD-binding domain-containing protein n=1 Tax=Bondarzewia mesenterica TaxID=1095465 RepID=A0A4S4L2I1_9AGAM|nr:hypothetical protein EW146_g9879 [Bondarzewia mesenterica]